VIVAAADDISFLFINLFDLRDSFYEQSTQATCQKDEAPPALNIRKNSLLAEMPYSPIFTLDNTAGCGGKYHK
jgi:hypothetical protein